MRDGSGGDNEDVKEKRRKEHKRKKRTTKFCERVGDVRGGRRKGKWWVGGMDGWMDG